MTPTVDLREAMGLPPVDDHEALLSVLGAPTRPAAGRPGSLRDLAGLDRGALEAWLSARVGPRWTSADDLDPEWRTAFDAVTARLTVPAAAVADAAGRHAFAAGVILELAARADASGGMAAWGFAHPPADPVLRGVVTGYGRPSIPVDAFAAVAHRMRERELGAAVSEPDMSEAAACLARVVSERVVAEVPRPRASAW